MSTERITVAQAIVRFLAAQFIVDDRDGLTKPLIPGVFAIFGHGNALGIGEALHTHRSSIKTLRGQNEQGMALAAVAFAKASRRRQVMGVTTSIGPGALNTVTAAGVAMANRLPLLLLLGDTFNSRMPDPVLQQIEDFSQPSKTANEALKPVSRYWDRITSPPQVLSSLPQAIAVLLDPQDCGPVTLALPQDVQAEIFDFPSAFFVKKIHHIARPRADKQALTEALETLKSAKRPLIVAGGGVHYSLAEDVLSDFSMQHGIPVMETVAGKSTLVESHPNFVGPIGVFAEKDGLEISWNPDVVVAVGTRLQDFTTESGTVFKSADTQLISINVSRFDAHKRAGLAVVADAKETLNELSEQLGDWSAPHDWLAKAQASRIKQRAVIAARSTTTTAVSTYAQVVSSVLSVADTHDYVLTSSGGLAGEMVMNWQSKGIATFDCEYGFSCMGYEISGGWGAALEKSMSQPASHVYSLAGDGSFMMLPMDIYSAVLTGVQNLSLIVCDNQGFNVIERLQINHGTPSFKTMLADEDHPNPAPIDFAAIASGMGAHAHQASDAQDLARLLKENREVSGVHVYVVEVAKHQWSEGDSFWEVGVPQQSEHAAVQQARASLEKGKEHQSQIWNRRA